MMDVIRIDQWRERAKHALEDDDIGLIAAIAIALGSGIVFAGWLVETLLF